MDVPDPYRGTTWTLEQASEYAKAALYAGVRSVARNREDWLLNTLYRTTSKTLIVDGRAVGVRAPGRPARPVRGLRDAAHAGAGRGARSSARRRPFTAGGKSYPAGSYVLRTQQRMGRFVNQILDNATYPSWAKPCATCPLTMPYSEFTDRVPIMFGLTADPVASAFTVATEPVATVAPETVLIPQAPPGDGRLPRPAGLLRHRQAARQPAEVGRADVPRRRGLQRRRA